MKLRRSTGRRRTAIVVTAIVAAGLGVTSLSAPAAQAQTQQHIRPEPSGYRLAQQYNPAPTSRTVRATAVHSTSGDVGAPTAVLQRHPTELRGAGSSIVLDFGKEIGGTLTLNFGAASDRGQQLGVAFAESSDWIDTTSEASTGGPRSRDGALDAPVTPGKTWTTPLAQQRGGFRYVTVFLQTSGTVDLTDVVAHLTASPLLGANIADYSNYFYSSDAQLNKIWYAGAYTVQLDTIASDQGRAWPAPDETWSNTGVVGVGKSTLVDGAKRDRTVWAGDLPVELATADVSTGDLQSARSSLTTLFAQQKPTGELPYSGPPLSLTGSDTYHLWTLTGAAHYYHLSGDIGWLRTHWSDYRLAVAFSQAKVDANGLLSITETADSAFYLAKGENLAANVLLWNALSDGARLAEAVRDRTTAAAYQKAATTLRSNIYRYFWDSTAGAFRDYPTSTVIPQDGNVIAVWLGMVQDPAQLKSISLARQSTWTPLGAARPEHKSQPDMFDSSIEVHEQFMTSTAQSDAAAVDLIRRTWGYQLTAPDGTNSTFWESMRPDGCICSTYVSLAHGWATGPTSAMTSFVLGITPTGTAGSAWQFAPHTSGLTFAQGRLDTPSGQLSGGWAVAANDSYTAHFSAPHGTTGRIGVPISGSRTSIYLNGRLVWNEHGGRADGAHEEGGYIWLDGIRGGNWDIRTSAE